jgi:hypothetical protein
MEVSGRVHAPATLPTGNEPMVPFDRRLGWPTSASFGNRTLIAPSSSPYVVITIVTEVS